MAVVLLHNGSHGFCALSSWVMALAWRYASRTGHVAEGCGSYGDERKGSTSLVWSECIYRKREWRGP